MVGLVYMGLCSSTVCSGEAGVLCTALSVPPVHVYHSLFCYKIIRFTGCVVLFSGDKCVYSYNHILSLLGFLVPDSSFF